MLPYDLLDILECRTRPFNHFLTFPEGWNIESIEPIRLEIRADFKDFPLSEGGPKGWFSVIRQVRA